MKRIVTFFAILAFGLSLSAQTALPFIRIDRDPATSAMGGAQAVSALYNPAAVPFADHSNVLASLQRWAPNGASGLHLNALGGIKIGTRLGLNVAAAYQGGEAYPVMDASGNSSGEFTPAELFARIGAGYAVTDALSLGASVQYASQSLAEGLGYSAVAADAFLLYRNGGLSATAGIASVGAGVKSGSTTYPLPTSVAAGVAYETVFAETNGILAAADFDYFLSGGIGLALGVQYAYDDMVFVRAGYHLGTEKAPIPSYASIGLGGKFSGVRIDLSYLTASPTLGGTVALGIGYAF